VSSRLTPPTTSGNTGHNSAEIAPVRPIDGSQQ